MRRSGHVLPHGEQRHTLTTSLLVTVVSCVIAVAWQ